MIKKLNSVKNKTSVKSLYNKLENAEFYRVFCFMSFCNTKLSRVSTFFNFYFLIIVTSEIILNIPLSRVDYMFDSFI